MTSNLSYTVHESPVGPLLLTARDRTLTGLYFRRHRHVPDQATLGVLDPGAFTNAIEQLDTYFAGTRTSFDLPYALVGTPFQTRVWDPDPPSW